MTTSSEMITYTTTIKEIWRGGRRESWNVEASDPREAVMKSRRIAREKGYDLDDSKTRMNTYVYKSVPVEVAPDSE